jgi:hypothetical protein
VGNELLNVFFQEDCIKKQLFPKKLGHFFLENGAVLSKAQLFVILPNVDKNTFSKN